MRTQIEILKLALQNYMAAYGQALEAHGIELQQQQIEADKCAREALAQQSNEQVELECYDAGLLGSGGGGDVDWWQDYIRAELGRAHDFYQLQIYTHPPVPTAQPEQEPVAYCDIHHLPEPCVTGFTTLAS